MKTALLALLVTVPLYADCSTVVFPPETKSLQFVQKNISDLGETASELEWSNRRSTGKKLEWTTTFSVEGKQRPPSTSEFRCSSGGVTPVDEGTRFTGVQYGRDLKRGSSWKFSWAATGISADYTYRVVKVEEVTVPAGTFQATRVDYTATARSATRGALPEITGSLWIVEGIGLVKQDENDPALGLIPERTTLELTAREKMP
jgi:hypothetical protein